MDDLSNPAETPRADPHAGCCGGWGLNTLGYPIRRRLHHAPHSFLLAFVLQAEGCFACCLKEFMHINYLAGFNTFGNCG
jgi:hypothetical protein